MSLLGGGPVRFPRGGGEDPATQRYPTPYHVRRPSPRVGKPTSFWSMQWSSSPAVDAIGLQMLRKRIQPGGKLRSGVHEIRRDPDCRALRQGGCALSRTVGEGRSGRASLHQKKETDPDDVDEVFSHFVDVANYLITGGCRRVGRLRRIQNET